MLLNIFPKLKKKNPIFFPELGHSRDAAFAARGAQGTTQGSTARARGGGDFVLYCLRPSVDGPSSQWGSTLLLVRDLAP